MNDKIKEFIATKIDEKNKKYQLEKEELLLKLGFYEKEFSPDNKYTEDFCDSELDGNGNIKYYKKVPIEITDEEYEELLKYSTEEEPSKNSILPMILTTIACTIFLFGFFAGVSYGNISGIFSLPIALSYWSIALISGSVFLALAEIIRLLDRNNHR